jgi:O-antigen/teichoic acid export membrane protein
VYGAVVGFVLAPVVGLIVSIYWTGFERKGTNYNFKKIINFAVPVILFSIAVNLIGSIDLFFVKALLPDANQASGFYSAASQIAKVPNYLVGALFSALFPAISSSMHLGNITKVQMYVNESLRNMLLFLMPVMLIISATSGKIVTLLYSSRYIQAGEPLSVLVIGIGMFSLFMLFVTIITGSGHPNAAMLLSFAVLGLDYALNVFLVPKYALIGAAAATTLASAFGLIIASFYTFRLFRVLTYPGSFLKISFSAAVIYIISLYVQLSGLALIMEYIVLFLIYTILLFILKELKKEDIQRVLGLIGAGYGRKI